MYIYPEPALNFDILQAPTYERYLANEGSSLRHPSSSKYIGDAGKTEQLPSFMWKSHCDVKSPAFEALMERPGTMLRRFIS
jgi:hypothetical protein